MSNQVQSAFFDLQVEGIGYPNDTSIKGTRGAVSVGDRARASWRERFTSLVPLGAKP